MVSKQPSVWQVTKVELQQGDKYTVFLRARLKGLTDYAYIQTTTTARDELEAYQKALAIFPLRKKEEP